MLHEIGDLHIEFTLLKSCFSFPKFSFALRTVDTTQHKDILGRFDASVKAALEAILGVPLPQLQWDQASLPVALGGLGLRKAENHASAAYLGSRGASATLVQEMR